MARKLLFDPEEKGRPMRVAAFMSGSGTNVIKLIEKEKSLEDKEGSSPFEVIFIFSDRSDGKSKGEAIALEAGIPYFSFDIRAFHRLKRLKRSVGTSEGLRAREEYDLVASHLVNAFDIDVIALGGYMSYTTLPRCINVHPADLSILTPAGKRKFVGDNAVMDAILDGEKTLRASTLWTDEGVDTGPLLIVSSPLKVNLSNPIGSLKNNTEELTRVTDEHQERLKEIGDWNIFPKTVEMIARGRFSIDEKNIVYVDERPVIEGYRE